MGNALTEIATRYRAQRDYPRSPAELRADVLELLARYRLRVRVASLVDAAADAAGAWAMFDSDHLDVDALTPELREAFEAAFPNMSLHDLVNRSPEAIEGISTAWRGKLYEVIVAKRLNAGEWVGGIHLDAGHTAVLADSANQPGWDIAISDEHGRLLEHLSLKATASASYIREALERYPDTRILATEDLHGLADHLATHVAIDDRVSASDLVHQVDAPLGDLHDSPAMEVFEDIAPYLAYALIVIQEGVLVARKRKPAAALVLDGAARGAKSLVARGVGAVAAVAAPALAAPAAFMTRLGMERASHSIGARKTVTDWRERLYELRTSPSQRIARS